MIYRDKPNEVLKALVSRYILGEDLRLEVAFTSDILKDKSNRKAIEDALEKGSNYSVLDGEICECCGGFNLLVEIGDVDCREPCEISFEIEEGEWRICNIKMISLANAETGIDQEDADFVLSSIFEY